MDKRIELTSEGYAMLLGRLTSIEKQEAALVARQDRQDKEMADVKKLLEQHSIHLRYLMAFGSVQVTILIGIFLKLLMG